MHSAAVGFRAKTGRAIAVVLSGSPHNPRFVWRGEVSLVDPEMTIGPYHEVMELPWSEAAIAVQKFVKPIERISNDVVRGLIEEMKTRNADLRVAGVVGSAPRSLERMGNPHIRAHAAEGVLFRRVLEDAAAANHLPCVAFSEAEARALAEAGMAAALKEFGREAGPPWRADERMAATVAWVALSRQ